MDFEFKPQVSDTHSETMDLLSRAWCNFAVHEALQTELHDRSLVLHNNSIKIFENEPKSPPLKVDTNAKMDSADRSIPSWKSNDVKSWIWMQQAMHPELNYNSCFRKKWAPWKMVPFRNVSINKWMKEFKQKRKEYKRLQRAEVHAAISVAGVAAALAAIAAAQNSSDLKDTSKEAAMASAAALVAAQCAKVAETMGAKREQLKTVLGSAMNATSTSDILTLTAAASTSLRGAATLKERTCCKNRLKGSSPVLPIEEDNDINLDSQKCLSTLAKGADLNTETSDGRRKKRSVSITLNNNAKVILKTKKLNLLNAFTSKKESVVLNQHAEIYKDPEGAEESDACFLVVLTTNRGIIKLDMMNDYHRYRMWATTVSHMLLLSKSLTKYELQFHKD